MWYIATLYINPQSIRLSRAATAGLDPGIHLGIPMKQPPREQQDIEWKESWRDEWLRAVCAFANAEGGTLVIGRNDQGMAVGLKDARKLLEELPNKVRDVLGVMVEVNLRLGRGKDAGKDTLEIVVPTYPNSISYKGEYCFRSGSTTQTLKGAALDRFLMRKHGRHWDDVPVPYVKASDLEPRTLTWFRQQALQSQRLPPSVLKEKTPALLSKLHLMDGSYLKRAAVMVFHPDPEKFVTGAFVKIGFFESNVDLRYHDEVHGDLFAQVNQTIEIIKAKYLKAWISYQGLQRLETYPVPEAALREAVLNAVVHKDYASAVPIQISVYPDKLMIWNCGQLPPNWTAATLHEKHSSLPYNPDIANAFFRAGMIEAWGRGIERIEEACAAARSPMPQFRYDATGLWTVFDFPKPPLEIQPIGGLVTDALSDPVTDPLSDPVADPFEAPLQRLLRVIGAHELAPSEIQRRLLLKHRPTFRENYLRPALQQKLVEMTIPEKPASRLQQYRLTASGQALAANLPKRKT